METAFLLVMALAVIVPVVGLAVSSRRADAGPRRYWIAAAVLFALPALILTGLAWARDWQSLSTGAWLAIAVYAVLASIVVGLVEHYGRQRETSA